MINTRQLADFFLDHVDHSDVAKRVATILDVASGDELLGRDDNPLGQLSDSDARWAIAFLVDTGLALRSRAYAEAAPDVREAVPGGCFVRMFCNDLSPRADELDAWAVAIANAQTGWADWQRVKYCIG